MTTTPPMTDPQKHADHVRELVADAHAVRRLGIEVLWAHGADDAVTLRARAGHRTLTAALGPGWLDAPTHRLADALARDLVADVHAPPPSMADGAPRWGWSAGRARRTPGPPAY